MSTDSLVEEQVELLRRRLEADPQAFRETFIEDGMNAVTWEFSQQALGEDFTRALWQVLLRGDDSSRVIMRFLWGVPLSRKRKFIRAIDTHLSDRYPMFAGLSDGWPAGNSIPPHIREPEARGKDFGLVNEGYLGYLNVGLTRGEVDVGHGQLDARLQHRSAWP